MGYLNIDDPHDEAQVALVTHAVISRLAKLQARFFSMPVFRTYVSNLDEETMASIKDEIVNGIEGVERGNLLSEVERRMQCYQSLCSLPDAFEAGDTPLHVAIRMGDFRYHETWQAYSEYADQPNDKGERPLDLAVALVKNANPDSSVDVRRDPFAIVHFLLKEGVEETPSYEKLAPVKKEAILNYRFGTAYLERASKAANSRTLIKVMKEIGADYSYSLKMKKEHSVLCMKAFIEAQRTNPNYETILAEMKIAINGGDNVAPAPELQYIRQLRSSLWIIRFIRGLLGGTSTQVELNGLINNEVSRLHPSCCYPLYAFFFNADEEETNVGNSPSLAT